jgi:hypothetical protein
MRPGSLTRQYKDPQHHTGAYLIARDSPEFLVLDRNPLILLWRRDRDSLPKGP